MGIPVVFKKPTWQQLCVVVRSRDPAARGDTEHGRHKVLLTRHANRRVAAVWLFAFHSFVCRLQELRASRQIWKHGIIGNGTNSALRNTHEEMCACVKTLCLSTFQIKFYFMDKNGFKKIMFA